MTPISLQHLQKLLFKPVLRVLLLPLLCTELVKGFVCPYLASQGGQLELSWRAETIEKCYEMAIPEPLVITPGLISDGSNVDGRWMIQGEPHWR